MCLENLAVPVIIQTNLPLEKRLQELASSGSSEFPDRSASYWLRYCQIKQWIADEYYQSAGAGLALQGERYTRHDISHVDDVIEKAGELLGWGSKAREPLFMGLHPYEVYVLLFAILLHDAGNALQRAEHEKQPKHIINAMGALSGVQAVERRLIASVAEAHGGRAPDGDKDTISKIIAKDVYNIGRLEVRARMLAAILRLADELAENPTRADPQAIRKPYNPPESAIHNVYCTAVTGRVDYEARAIFLNYLVTIEQLSEEFVPKKGSRKRVLLVDYISERVQKCDCERRYCNRFMPFSRYERINVNLEVLNNEDASIETISAVIADEGYPDASKSLKIHNPRFDGVVLRNAYVPQNPDLGAAL